MLEDQPNDRLGQHHEQHRSNQIHEDQVTQPLLQRAAELRVLFFRRQAGQRRQQIGRQRNAEDALRQFHQPHRVIKGRNDLPVHPKSQAVGEEHIHLKRRHAERAGNHFPNDFAHGWVAPGRDPLIAKPFAAQGRPLKSGLRDARDQHADGQPENLLVQFPAQARCEEQDGGDHHEVEHHRPGRRNEEVAARVEHSHEDGGKTDHQHVGKHDAKQRQHEAGVRLKLARRQGQ